jgi:hypothetical protein
MGDISGTISTAIDVASDPYMPEIICRIQQLKQIGRNEVPQICADTPSTVASSVGLQSAVPALRAYVYAQQNPWVYPAAIAAIIGLPFWLGYELGRGK